LDDRTLLAGVVFPLPDKIMNAAPKHGHKELTPGKTEDFDKLKADPKIKTPPKIDRYFAKEGFNLKPEARVRASKAPINNSPARVGKK